jgi:hypothetical protein
MARTAIRNCFDKEETPMTISRILLLLLAFAVSSRAQEVSPPPKEAAPAEEAAVETTDDSPYEVEAGFQLVRTDGNREMYRTQLNEQSGFVLRSFTMLTADVPGVSPRFFDRLRIDASDLGAGPAGSLHIEADKRDLYRFRLGYRHMDLFSAIPDLRTFDRTSNALDVDLELLPGHRVTPFAGISFNRLRGPGTTTTTLGGDEFHLSQNFNQIEQEVRAGAAFNAGWLQGSFTQGWRRSRGAESLTLSATDSAGNSLDPLLGRPVLASGLTRQDRTRVNTPFTSLFVTGQPTKRVRVVADYVRFAADSSGDLTENAEGSFVSFALSRFFGGMSDAASSRAKNTTWRGGARVEVALIEHLTAFAGYQKEHRDLEGSALIDTLYLQTLTFGGVDPRDVQVVLNANSSIARDEDVASVGASARSLGPFAVRVEYRETKQNLSVAPDLLEIVVPGSQSGDFERRIRMFDTNVSFARPGFTLGGAYRRDRAGDPIFRTDFRDRDRLRLRAVWSAPKWIRAGITAERTTQSNTQPGIDLDGTTRQATGDVEVIPHEGVAFRASLSRFRADHSVLIRRPENFVTEPSLYAEDGNSHEGGVALNLAPLSFDASRARFTNRGTTSFDIDRVRVRFGFDLPARMRSTLIAEYGEDKFSQRSADYANFNSRRFGFFVQYRPKF